MWIHTTIFSENGLAPPVSEPEHVGEGKVSNNQASIPPEIRRALGFEDGDTLRWRVVDDELRVTVVSTEAGAFDDFEPGRSDAEVDAVEEHDAFGVE